jgi:tRNA(His) 5'-end guanylyltransferase
MALRDALGDRMKSYYEDRSKTKLTRRMPVIIRLDGKAFHTFTRGFKKPFDEIMIKTMQQTMQYLCENIQGCILGYTQSDEITLVLQDYYKLETDAWFDYEVQKIVSISAAMATLAFNKYYYENIAEMTDSDEDFKKYAAKLNKALFDSRAFNLPKEEVANCLIWRQLDAERNSVNSVAQANFSHKELQSLNLKDTMTKLEQEKGIVWGNLSTVQKRGTCCVREYWCTLPDGQVVKDKSHITYGDFTGEFYYDGDGYYFFKTGFKDNPNGLVFDKFGLKLDVKEHSKWVLDTDIPRFVEDREYINELVYKGEC